RRRSAGPRAGGEAGIAQRQPGMLRAHGPDAAVTAPRRIRRFLAKARRLAHEPVLVAVRPDWSTQPSLTAAHRPPARRGTRDAQGGPGRNLANRTVRQGHGSADGETVRACARRDASYARRALPAQPHHPPAAL